MPRLLPLLLLLILPMALPAATADDMVQYRVQMMETAHRHLKALAAIADGRVPLGHHATEHARALQAFGRLLPDLFPRGSLTPGSEARPEIWQRWPHFTTVIARFTTTTDALMAAAAAGDPARLRLAYDNTLEACKGCHREFRAR